MITNARRLSEIFRRENNNFDLIRLIAALAVLWGHAPMLQKAHGNIEPIGRFLQIEYTGSLGVYAFFLLSGMLVTASFERKKSAGSFLALRVSRLWPGLIGNVLISALVVGPLFSSLPFAEYLKHSMTLDFIEHNIFLFDGLRMGLPAVFEKSVAPDLINPTLWTLPIEFHCYIAVLVLGLAGLLRRQWTWLLGCAAVFAAFMFVTAHPPTNPIYAPMFLKNGGYSFYPVPIFLLGMALYAVRDRIILDWRIAIGLAAAYVALHGTSASDFVFYPAFIYGVLTISASPFLHRFRPPNDYSYGIYIYGFMCQQIVSVTFPTISSYASLVLSVPLTLLFAAASWHLIERPALKICRRLTMTKTPSSPVMEVG